MKKFICSAILVATLVSPVWGRAETAALQTVENYVNQLLDALGKKASDGPGGEERKKEAIRSISSSLFDFRELSRFSLGAGWRRLTPEQQGTFIDLYRRLLESIYMGRLLQYKDEKVVFKNESALSDTRREVQTEVIRAGGNIPMDYRLVNEDGVWKVYDVIIENASLARNYRAQFNSILAKDSADQLLDMLRQKVKEQDAPAN
jgi:phospholipid transport system substrate-binding protein